MKTVNFKRIICAILSSAMLLSIIPCVALASGAVYVSTTGNDTTGTGTIGNPYKTINHAISKMQAGDTCYIMGGIYNESVEITFNSDSKTRFVAYEGGQVTVIPSQQITGWEEESDNIWKAPMNWNINRSDENLGERNMVFANGQPCYEARWPNIALDADQTNGHPLLVSDNYDSAAEGTGALDANNNLTFVFGEVAPDFGDLTGAVIWCSGGSGWVSYHYSITDYDSATNTATTSTSYYSRESSYIPKADKIYYITRHKNLLDCEGEWYKDVENNTLYYYTENPAGPQNIAAKSSEYALLLKGARNVEIDGIDFTGGLVEFDANSSYCSIFDSVMETLEYHLSTNNMQATARGVTIDGSHNLMHGCEVKNMYSEGVNVAGTYNRLLNCYIHDANFEHSGADGIYITGKNCLVSHNTVTRTARSVIGGKFKSCVVSYNDFSNANLISKDTGLAYFANHNFENSEIHHNTFHDGLNNSGLQYAFYLDSNTCSLVVYKNLIYNVEYDNITQSNSGRLSLNMNPNSLANIFVNNTIINTTPISMGRPEDISGSAFINNLFKSVAASEMWNVEYDVVYENNMQCGDFWTSLENDDYTLKEGSSAIDAGAIIPGITDEYEGNAPDCGAFEYGEDPWVAGYDFSKDYTNEQFELNADIPYINLLENNSFEHSDFLHGWGYIGAPAKSVQTAWYFTKYTKEGSNSVELEDGEKIYRTISDLEPNTQYEFFAYTVLGIDDNIKRETDITSGTTKTYTVDFKNGEYDLLYVGFESIDAATSGITVTLENGTKLLTISPNAWNFVYTSHAFWVPVKISNLTGKQKIKVTYTNTANKNSTFLGVHPYCSESNENVVITLTSDSGEVVESKQANTAFTNKKKKIYITTGDTGEVDIEIEKKGSALNGYVDFIYFAQSGPFVETDYDIFAEDFNREDMDVYETNVFLDSKFSFVYQLKNSGTSAASSSVDNRLGSQMPDGEKFDTWQNKNNTVCIEDGALKITKNDYREHQIIFGYPHITKRKAVKISFDFKFDAGGQITLLGESPLEPIINRDKQAAKLIYTNDGSIYFKGTISSEETKITTAKINEYNKIEIVFDLEDKEVYTIINGEKSDKFTCDINGISYFKLTIPNSYITSGTYIDNFNFIPVCYENEEHDLSAINATIKKLLDGGVVEISKPESGILNIFEAKMFNSLGENIPMKGILGVYDVNGKLADVIVSDRNITPENDIFGIGTIIEQNEATVKLFTWNSGSDNPLLNDYTFKK